MGGTSYTDSAYASRVRSHVDAGTDPHVHTAAIRSGTTAAKVHKLLDPKGKNTFDKVVRESFDSDVHPNSRAVAVFFDVTGSMAEVPGIFWKKLPELMAMLVKKGFLESPHVLFGAVGDATCDKVPLQIGQFEGGNEMDEAMANVYLEKGGGGQQTESYELAMYFMARKADMHCFTKRGQKGIMFILGDETPYPMVKKSEVRDIIGDSLEADIPLEDILTELRQKFEVFWIIPAQTNNYDDAHVNGVLRKLFGQQLLKLEDPKDICELIVQTIGLLEGYDLRDLTAAMKSAGADPGSVSRASTALTAYAGSTSVTKTAKVSGSLVGAGKSADDVDRI